jgi:hypothetical protein
MLALIWRTASCFVTAQVQDIFVDDEPLNVALLVADFFRLGFERPWNRYHFALADVRNPDCSGQEQEMGKTDRLHIGQSR